MPVFFFVRSDLDAPHKQDGAADALVGLQHFNSKLPNALQDLIKSGKMPLLGYAGDCKTPVYDVTAVPAADRNQYFDGIMQLNAKESPVTIAAILDGKNVVGVSIAHADDPAHKLKDLNGVTPEEFDALLTDIVADKMIDSDNPCFVGENNFSPQPFGIKPKLG